MALFRANGNIVTRMPPFRANTNILYVIPPTVNLERRGNLEVFHYNDCQHMNVHKHDKGLNSGSIKYMEVLQRKLSIHTKLATSDSTQCDF
jgi:hypothetical protein